MPRIARRVVCGFELVMATFSPTSAFVRVDLPTLGRPTKVTNPARNVGSSGTPAPPRGLRALTDFEYEFQRALLIKHVDPDIETVFMMTSSEFSFVSSSATKELAKFGGSIRGLVPVTVEEQILRRLNDRAMNDRA